MSLIKCPDCTREVSDSAPSCPGCGRQIAAAKNARRSKIRTELGGVVAFVGIASGFVVGLLSGSVTLSIVLIVASALAAAWLVYG